MIVFQQSRWLGFDKWWWVRWGFISDKDGETNEINEIPFIKEGAKEGIPSPKLTFSHLEDFFPCGPLAYFQVLRCQLQGSCGELAPKKGLESWRLISSSTTTTSTNHQRCIIFRKDARSIWNKQKDTVAQKWVVHNIIYQQKVWFLSMVFIVYPKVKQFNSLSYWLLHVKSSWLRPHLGWIPPQKKSKQLFIPIDFIPFHGTFQGGFVGFKLHTNAASDVQPARDWMAWFARRLNRLLGKNLIFEERFHKYKLKLKWCFQLRLETQDFWVKTAKRMWTL